MGAFELFADRAGEFRFRLKANNGQVILVSEGYTTKAAAHKGITSVGANAYRAGAFETFDGKDGKHYFRLKAANGQVVASSQGYVTPAGCENGMRSVQSNALGRVTDLSDEA